jgi:alpha-beta hydrolase superfamily lysophospholipase
MIDEGCMESTDGQRLYWRRHTPEKSPHAALLIVHGLAEHSGRYVHVLDHFANAGFDCWAYDYRCHGQSPGLRVHVEHFDEFLIDLEAARQLVGEKGPDLPLFLVGHSQGGLIVLREALTHPQGLEGIAVSSPFLGMHPTAAPSAPLHMVANIVSAFMPKMMFSKVAEPSALSRDPKVPEAYIADPLVSTTVSARWFTSVLRAHADTQDRAPTLSVPALVMQSGEDRLTDPAATRAWVADAPSDLVDYVEWEGLYHEMFNEPEKEMVFERVEQWLETRLGG